MSDIVQTIELRLMNEDSKIYGIFFQGEILGERYIPEMFRHSFGIKVCQNQEKMSQVLNQIGVIFCATFYANNVPIISGTPNFNGIEFNMYEKNAEPCTEYTNSEKITINI